MPKDYSLAAAPINVQRRPALAQDDAWIKAFLLRAQVGYVATHWDNQPFMTPTTFWYDADQGRLIFHSNVVGRVRANADRHPQVCFAVSEHGALLPANVALEFSIQYASVLVYGQLQVLATPEAQRAALYGLIGKYFPDLQAGREYRPITDQELRHTSVYAIAIESWSGKLNWPAAADQSDEWPPLPDPASKPRPTVPVVFGG